MASSDVALQVQDVSAVPQDYTVPPAQEIIPLCVTASLDGAAAASQYVPTLEILAPSGAVVARCPTSTVVAAGGSADTSWFPLRAGLSDSSPISTFQAVVLNTPDVRSYWPLDETTGTTFEDLGPSNVPLTMGGPPTIGQAPLITAGHSAAFSGAVDGIGRAKQYAEGVGTYGTWPAPNSFTVIMWLQTTFSAATNPFIFGFDDGHFRIFQFRLGGVGKAAITTFRSATTANAVVSSATTVNDGVKRMLAATFNGSTFATKVYLNGVLDGSGVGVGSYSTTAPNPVLMAHDNGGSPDTPAGGTADEVAIFSRDLTASELLAIYSAGIT